MGLYDLVIFSFFCTPMNIDIAEGIPLAQDLLS